MAVVFAWRSDTTTSYTANGASARYGAGGTTLTAFGLAVQNSAIGITSNAAAIGGKELDCSNANSKVLQFPGGANFGSTGKMSMLIRFRAPTIANTHMLNIGASRWTNGINITVTNLGHMVVYAGNEGSSAAINSITITTATMALTSTMAYTDFVFTYDFQTTTAAWNTYFNATLTTTPAIATRFLTTTSSHSGSLAKALDPFTLLNGPINITSLRTYLNEVVIWDTLIDPTNITLVDPSSGVTSTGQSLNGSTRSGFVDVGSFNGAKWDSLPASQIQSGISQIQAGLTQTGTDTGTNFWASLAAANIRSGFSQLQNGSTVSGSFSGETWTTITAAQILAGVNQIQNGTTITGTLSVPTAVSGTAATVNIGNIKEQIRYVLAQNNTSTGAEVTDLSGNMTRAVQNVFKYNPEKIPLSAHMLPAVYIFTDQKTISPKTIAKDQVTGKREAELSFNIAGAVWNPLIVNQNTVDPADEDLEKLMENIERIIRSYSDLGATVRWQFPEAVTYHSIPIDEQSHLRVSYMKLSCKVFY